MPITVMKTLFLKWDLVQGIDALVSIGVKSITTKQLKQHVGNTQQILGQDRDLPIDNKREAL
jgi:hypothetical protein